MKYALAFTDHTRPPRGPITRSLFQAAEKNDIPMLFSSREEKWDDYDLLIWFHNRPPQMKTTAKVAWWMCDARTPETVLKSSGTAGNADYVFLCNSFMLKQYEKVFDVQAFHVPQCGDDMEGPACRPINGDCVFIGAVPEIHPRHTRQGRHYLDPIGPAPTDEDFFSAIRSVHLNRLPIISYIKKSGISVDIIHGERVTQDQKSIYSATPFSLAISPQIPGYTSNRLYNILASGGFCLTLKYPCIEEQFENHKHLVWFETAEEAVDLIRYYKDNPAKMQEIRDNGHAEYLRNHSAERRIEQMVALIEGAQRS